MTIHPVDEVKILEAHKRRKEGLKLQIERLSADLAKEENVYSSFVVVEESGQFWRQYKDESREGPYGSYEGCVRWYIDGGR